MYPGRWHDYFDAIEKGLPRLHHFGFGTNAEWEVDVVPFEKEKEIVPILLKDRYMISQGRDNLGFRMVDDIEWPKCDEMDQEALTALYRKTGQRVDYGTVEIGRYCTVENLIQTKGY